MCSKWMSSWFSFGLIHCLIRSDSAWSSYVIALQEAIECTAILFCSSCYSEGLSNNMVADSSASAECVQKEERDGHTSRRTFIIKFMKGLLVLFRDCECRSHLACLGTLFLSIADQAHVGVCYCARMCAWKNLLSLMSYPDDIFDKWSAPIIIILLFAMHRPYNTTASIEIVGDIGVHRPHSEMSRVVREHVWPVVPA